jgi:outer membrane lipoprotein carrier protein
MAYLTNLSPTPRALISPVFTWFALIALSWGTPVLAVTLQDVQERYLAIRSFAGTFTQQTASLNSEIPVRQAQGTIAYERPGKMRWEYGAPEEQLLVTDGETLWLFDPLLENVTIQALAAVTDGTALAFLLGVGELTEDFTQRRVTQSLLSEEEGWEVLELVPNLPVANVEFVQLGVAPDTGDLQALLVMDRAGSYRTIVFRDLSYDVTLDASQFTFEITPRMEVIRP